MSVRGFLDPSNAVSVFRGASKTFLLSVEQPDPDNPGTCIPVPLGGMSTTIYFTLREKLSSSEIVLQKTSAESAQIEITDPNGGLARIFLTGADTLELSRCQYVFDVWVVLDDGSRHVVIEPSTLRVLDPVTRF